jgi:tetratricopeptide (TPR) repeat protein
VAPGQRPVVLSMIVRDESRVIERCLASVLPFITHWAIVDTGSADDTCALIAAALAEKPGRLDRVTWQNDFALHRNQALALARDVVGESNAIALFIDADEALCGTISAADLVSSTPSDVAYQWWVRDSDFCYRKLGLASLSVADVWVGKRHEYLELKSTHSVSFLQSCWLLYGQDGYRRRDGSTFSQDVLALRENAEASPKQYRSPRDVFFLARTYESAGDTERAATYFSDALSLFDVDGDEYWQALWGLARCNECEAIDTAALSQTFLEMHLKRPDRAEPLMGLSRVAMKQQQFKQAFELASAAFTCDVPTDSAVVDVSCYSYGAAAMMAEVSLLLGKAARDKAQESLRDCLVNQWCDTAATRRVELALSRLG